ncbi:phytoene/squalene synthase family protein [Larkinella soli]|uniref:phytoene/squalene synthase family protein n=1 Tax=Larkinella soli TaxID=1770527 RepID=UPI000FFBBF45|nr:phytoene/squalene synthase family protein [Larkinella soli]
MSIALFHRTAGACGRIITRAYSTSFSIGVRLLAARFRPAIYAIYGYVRFADEIVDTFHEYDKAELLERFRADTNLAREQGISLNPVIHAFTRVMRHYRIGTDLLDAFLDSMAMDLTNSTYQTGEYRTYVYGSAEVVGLMCLRVFCEGDEVLYGRLQEPARRLGAAFQKVNFLRDLASDFGERGRLYFPGVDFERFSEADKRQIEAEIAADFKAALAGIRALPKGARLGVYVAYRYYLDLFRQLCRVPPRTLFTRRIRVSDRRKLWLLLRSSVRHYTLPV